MAERQVIVFKLGDNNEYCIDIGQVREIVRVQNITSIPGTPDFVEGIVNLRDLVIPVMDIRKKFSDGKFSTTADNDTPASGESKNSAALDAHRPMIVTTLDGKRKGESREAGILVSSVSEILRISDEDIEEAPHAAEYISGVAKVGERLIVILDLYKVLSDTEELVAEPEKQPLRAKSKAKPKKD